MTVTPHQTDNAKRDAKSNRVKRVRAFISKLLRRDDKPAVVVPSACPWTVQDKENLRAFLLSASGQRFIRKCRVIEYANAISGCERQTDYSHAAGRTAGCREMITFIVGELAVNFDKPEEMEQPDIKLDSETAEAWLERMSP